MSEQFWLSDEQIESLLPYFPRSRGKARVDDRRVLSGIIHVQRNGLRWCDAPAIYGPHKTLYNRRPLDPQRRVRPHLRRPGGGGWATGAHHHRQHAPQGTPDGCQLAAEKGGPRRIGRTRGGLNSKLHAICDRHARPLVLLLSQGQMNDHKGAGLLIDALPPARELIADRGYDSDGFRAALEALGIAPCIPSRKNRKHPHPHDPALYRQRHPIENLFAKLKDWRRIATRYDRCADIFMGAITLAATVIFWLPK